MAKNRFMGFFGFLLMLILCHELICVEGRHLKSKHHDDDKNSLKATKDVSTTIAIDSSQEQTTTTTTSTNNNNKMEQVNDFRPTTPGHSPGIGHSVNN